MQTRVWEYGISTGCRGEARIGGRGWAMGRGETDEVDGRWVYGKRGAIQLRNSCIKDTKEFTVCPRFKKKKGKKKKKRTERESEIKREPGRRQEGEAESEGREKGGGKLAQTRAYATLSAQYVRDFKKFPD